MSSSRSLYGRTTMSLSPRPSPAWCHIRASSGEQSDRGELGGSAADPVPHREAFDPRALLRDFVELAAFSGDRHRVLAEVEAAPFVRRLRLHHAVARLLGATRLAHHDRERL